jgi:hypothetical protein
MSNVIAANVLANGLRNEFADTYMAIRNRQADSRVGTIMDLSIGATNRKHEFAYFEAAPHMEYWRRGDTIPTDGMDSVQFQVQVYEWARRVPWSKWDRKDDQTQSLMDVAKMAGESAALLPERFLFDIINGITATLPAIPNAPDGVDIFNATDGDGGNRFGVSGGNIVAGGAGVGSGTNIQSDFYEAIERFKAFQDGKGQPLLSDETIDSGFIICHPAEHTEAFESAFMQTRRGDTVGTASALGAATNLIQEANRNVTLWGTQRMTGNNYAIFLRNPPKKPTFLLDREGVQEFTSLEGDNNSDHTRNTGEEYVQWEVRQGAGVALPFAAMQVAP